MEKGEKPGYSFLKESLKVMDRRFHLWKTLERMGVKTIEDVISKTEGELLAIEGVSPNSIKTLKTKLSYMGLQLKRDNKSKKERKKMSKMIKGQKSATIFKMIEEGKDNEFIATNVETTPKIVAMIKSYGTLEKYREEMGRRASHKYKREALKPKTENSKRKVTKKLYDNCKYLLKKSSDEKVAEFLSLPVEKIKEIHKSYKYSSYRKEKKARVATQETKKKRDIRTDLVPLALFKSATGSFTEALSALNKQIERQNNLAERQLEKISEFVDLISKKDILIQK